MFEVPGSDISTVIITEKVVTSGEVPGYIRAPKLLKVKPETPDEPGCDDEEEVKVRQS